MLLFQLSRTCGSSHAMLSRTCAHASQARPPLSCLHPTLRTSHAWLRAAAYKAQPLVTSHARCGHFSPTSPRQVLTDPSPAAPDRPHLATPHVAKHHAHVSGGQDRRRDRLLRQEEETLLSHAHADTAQQLQVRPSSC
jgi:hypothetical protein